MPFCEAVGVNATFTWKSSVEKSKSFLSTTPKLGNSSYSSHKFTITNSQIKYSDISTNINLNF